MADYTDSPFSLICREFGADVIYREMVSAEAVVRGNEKTLKMAEFKKGERPVILQIFGKDAAVLAEAAVILEEKYAPDGIDINMGCPARKIVSNFNGASLMRDAALSAKIVESVKNAIKIPVSVKTRTGWERETEILEFSKIIEAAGADALAVHGRTKHAGYAGKANWEIIGQVKRQLRIPVILNGDVVDYASFKQAMETSEADGVLIGRGAIGNPWIFRNISAKGGPVSGWKNKKDGKPSAKEIKITVLAHAKAHLARYGELVTFRKHLLAYFKGAPGAKKMRAELAKIKTLKELTEIL